MVPGQGWGQEWEDSCSWGWIASISEIQPPLDRSEVPESVGTLSSPLAPSGLCPVCAHLGCFFFFFFAIFLGQLLWHMEVPRLGVKLEL